MRSDMMDKQYCIHENEHDFYFNVLKDICSLFHVVPTYVISLNVYGIQPFLRNGGQIGSIEISERGINLFGIDAAAIASFRRERLGYDNFYKMTIFRPVDPQTDRDFAEHILGMLAEYRDCITPHYDRHRN